MALINCPHCKRPVTDTRDVCIHCGESIMQAMIEKEEIEALDQSLNMDEISKEEAIEKPQYIDDGLPDLQSEIKKFKSRNPLYIIFNISLVILGAFVALIAFVFSFVFISTAQSIDAMEMAQNIFSSGNIGDIISYTTELLKTASFDTLWWPILVAFTSLAIVLFIGDAKYIIIFLSSYKKQYSLPKTVKSLKDEYEATELGILSTRDYSLNKFAWPIVLVKEKKNNILLYIGKITNLLLFATIDIASIIWGLQGISAIDTNIINALKHEDSLIEILKIFVTVVIILIVCSIINAIIKKILEKTEKKIKREYIKKIKEDGLLDALESAEKESKAVKN